MLTISSIASSFIKYHFHFSIFQQNFQSELQVRKKCTADLISFRIFFRRKMDMSNSNFDLDLSSNQSCIKTDFAEKYNCCWSISSASISVMYLLTNIKHISVFLRVYIYGFSYIRVSYQIKSNYKKPIPQCKIKK